MGLATVTLARSEGFVLRALATSLERLPKVDGGADRTVLPLETAVRRPDMDEAEDEIPLPRMFFLCNIGCLSRAKRNGHREDGSADVTKMLCNALPM